MYNLKKGYNNTLNYIIYTYLKLVEVFQLKNDFFLNKIIMNIFSTTPKLLVIKQRIMEYMFRITI